MRDLSDLLDEEEQERREAVERLVSAEGWAERPVYERHKLLARARDAVQAARHQRKLELYEAFWLAVAGRERVGGDEPEALRRERLRKEREEKEGEEDKGDRIVGFRGRRGVRAMEAPIITGGDEDDGSGD